MATKLTVTLDGDLNGDGVIDVADAMAAIDLGRKLQDYGIAIYAAIAKSEPMPAPVTFDLPTGKGA